ncbi:hypothetical protein J4Q44_G00065110 [Coregonus suidteri]|uniref:Uncharacterized protein n=1 Tax=Coregonus suidteri TaxID=861788 RepID=A0AAN8RE90_9TELE
MKVGCGTTCYPQRIGRSWERTVDCDVRNTTTGLLCLAAPIHSPADTSTLSWSDIRPFEKRRDATVVFWDIVVYILGGSQLFPIKRMDCYNILKDNCYSKRCCSAWNLSVMTRCVSRGGPAC